jgi:hypothetical protein
MLCQLSYRGSLTEQAYYEPCGTPFVVESVQRLRS